MLNDGIKIDFPSEPYKTKILETLNACNKEYYGFVSVDIQKPYKARTTGKGSQNNYVWALIQLIANQMGEDIDYVENKAKLKAIAKGYPYHITAMGDVEPNSMTTVNTVECGYLIDTLLEMCAFLGVVVPELNKKETKENTDTQSLVDQALAIEEYKGDIF